MYFEHRIVQEKQTGVKELMKMMGLPSWMNWVYQFTFEKKARFHRNNLISLIFFQVFYFFDAIMTLIISIAIMTLIITVEWKSGEGSIIGKKHALEKYDQFFILGDHITNF